ncbi:MAG TPA: TetR/AcrR family transcriptional regulator [Leptospiraceae bacterium]|nr:TetR/AcrR family transcriptional regulator [Leptospiraceae bacterium]HRG45065.1 TetR/AcrR family transcriptional regulator [Leptospiraceae bacterium]HRG73828.1 TetR/AcrR family transcriptional regulator [Leptospiraceae bacterium]
MGKENSKTKMRIIDKACELFLAYGYSRVTMDEICRSLVMSRKTMYTYFSNKEELLREVILNRSQCRRVAIDGILSDSTLDFMQRFRKMIEYISKESPRESIHFMQDIKTNAPNIWSEMIEIRNKDIPIRMGNFLKDGIKRGIVKKNMKTDIFIRMHLAVVNELMNPETLLEMGFTVAEMIQEIDSVLFFGIIDQNAPEFHKPTPKNNKIKK